MMRKYLFVFISVLSILISGCKETEVLEVKVSLNKSVLTLDKGETETLRATVSPSNADVELKWSSSDRNVATVGSDGQVTAVSAGEAVVTVSAGKAEAECKVTVNPVAVESVSLNEETLQLTVGDEYTLEATILPADADDAVVTWKSLKEDIVSVDSNGKVKALSTGGEKTAHATVVAEAGGKIAQCTIEVLSPVVNVESVRITEYVETMIEGETFTFKAEVKPDDATDRSVVWTSANPEVITITEDGQAVAVEAGTVEITVTSTDGGKTDKCVVIVEPAVVNVESVEITSVPEGNKMIKGEEFTLAAVVTPADATDASLKWSTSDDKVLTVDQNGKVTATGGGTAEITVTANDGGKTDKVSITVEVLVESVQISSVPADSRMIVGDEFTFAATVTPSDATDTSVQWTSSDKNVLTIDETGKAVAVAAGNVKVTVTTTDGGKTASCDIVVENPAPQVIPVESVSISASPEGNQMKIGDTFVFAAVVTPSDATDKTVIWSSSDKTVLTIDEEGKAVAVAAGKAVVTVTANDGGKTDKKEITVVTDIIPVESVRITDYPQTIKVGESYKFKAEVKPADATDKTVIWESSNKEVLTIDSEGNASALEEGTVYVTAASADGSKVSKVTVTVESGVVPVESVKITSYPADNQMKPGDTFKFEADVLPADADDKSVTWSSSATDVISIDASGNAKALKVGEATVTVTTKDGGKKDQCTVRVAEPTIAVATVKIADIPTGNRMYIGDEFVFTANITPENATDKEVIWKTDNEQVLSIDSNGKAVAKSVGQATVSVTTKDGGKVDKITISVIDKNASATLQTFTLSTENSIDFVRHGKTIQIIPSYEPEGAYPKTSSWHCDNTKLATVDDNGIVKAISFDYSNSHSYYNQNGYPEVTITHIADGIAKNFKLKIYPAVPEKIVVTNPPPTSMTIGQTWNLGDIYILPEEAEQKVTIICTNNGEFGGELGRTIEANTVGTMSILIEATGEHAQTVYTGTDVVYNINVKPIDVTSVSLSRSSYYIEEGSEFDLTYTVYPSNATYRNVSWTSSSPSVARVENGRVKALAAGTATITATSVNGKTASCSVTVTSKVSTVKVGDYYYSDGTTSSELQSGKTPIGVVFAIADPVGSDPATLGKSHPGCTHGLVVGIESYTTKFSSDMYPTISAGNVHASALNAGMIDMKSTSAMCGYSNTTAFRTWGNTWAFLDKISEANSEYALSSNTSGWYLPSVAELDLLKNVNVLVDDKLKAIGESHGFGTDVRLWTSTYFGVSSNSYTYVLMARNGVDPGLSTGSSIISSEYKARFIFAF